MKRDIENQFFKAYKPCGVVDNCIEVICQRYDLRLLPDNAPLYEERQRDYDETLPNTIEYDTKSFDYTVINTLDSPLIDEISDNLSECKTMQEKERYIHSLIVPFRRLSELLYPANVAEQRMKNEIRGLTASLDFQGRQTDTELIEEQIRQSEATLDGLINIRKQCEQNRMISKRFWQILREPTDVVEKSFFIFCGLMFRFANQLDALLLKNVIDILRLQNECGVYLKTHRNVTVVDYYIGSPELTRKYIEELPEAGHDEINLYIDKLTEQPQPDTAKPQQLTLPPDLLQALQSGGFIEDATARPLRWLKNKQLARELLTYEKIKGNLSDAEVERQSPLLFIYYKDNEPLHLAKNKHIESTDSDNLGKILATF
jgi:hypothetical protein